MTCSLFFVGLAFAIILAGFISGSETALTGASRAYLYHLAKKGDVRAKKVIDLQKNMSNVISTVLVINQLIVFLITTVVTLVSVHFFCATHAVIIQTITGILLVIYAEIFPKMVAIKFATQFALFAAPFIKGAVVFFFFFITVLEYIAKITLKLLRVDMSKQDSPEQADEELRGAIEMHSSDGDQEEAEKKSMLKSILDLEEIAVSHAMVHRKHLFTIDVSLPIEKIAEELTICPFSRVPLWKDNSENIIGVLKVKTFLRALQLSQGDYKKIKIQGLMSDPWFIPETTHLLDQLRNFKKRREHFALVVDEYGDLLGCITLEDILEEIVGEIADEYDAEPMEDGISVQADGTVIADGSTPIRDLNRQFDWDLPEEGASTIGGYVMYYIRKIPDIGQLYVISGFRIEILRKQGNQINLVKIIPPSSSD